MVHAAGLDPILLINAMEKGDFYSTTGVQLDSLEFKNGQLFVSVKSEPGIDYTIQFWGAGKSGPGQILKEVKAKKASYRLQKSDLYVRGKIISTKKKENPYAAGDVETAWTQPVRL